MDKLIHGTAADGSIRIISAVSTGIVRDAARRHNTSPTATAALGRVLTGTLLLAATQKDFDRFTVKVEANGPIGGIVAEATPAGTVRGYVKQPEADAAPNGSGKFDVAGIVGGGTFYVIRESGFDLGLHREPYVGSVPIVSGEIAEDFAFYLAKSEQIPSAVLLGVLLQNTDPYIAHSGGVMLQMLPGANEHLVTMIEDSVANSPHVTELLKNGGGPEELLQNVLGGIDHEILGERDIAFECNCSMERAIALIASLGKAEVESMLKEDGGAVMDCGFCGESYKLEASDLEAILAEETA